MKRILTVIALIALSITSILAMESFNHKNFGDQDHKDIEKLWKEYNSAEDADRPSKQLEVLDRIKQAAIAERSPWDFYLAGDKYVSVSYSRNWKLRDSLLTAFQKEIDDFNEPVLTFFNTRNILTGKEDFLEQNRKALEGGRNEDFYDYLPSPYLSQFVQLLKEKYLKNDYEFALWYLYLNAINSRQSSFEMEKISGMLDECINGRYPLPEFKEFVWLESRDYSTKSLEDYKKKYDGKAVSLFAEQELMYDEMQDLGRKDASSDEYKAFRKKCGDFEKSRKAFSGEEKSIAECCTKVEGLIARLDDKSVQASVSDDVVTIVTRNLSKVNLTLKKDDKTTFNTSIKNEKDSYYVYDTTTFRLPIMDDGSYEMECSNGKENYEAIYERYTISVASKKDKNGSAIFAVDAVSGKPLSKIEVVKSGSNENVLAEMSGFDSKGFVYVPENIQALVDDKKSRTGFVCRYKDANGIVHLSQESNFGRSYYSESKKYTETYASIFTDRSAFNPDEIVHFKAIVYSGDRRESLKVAEEGTEVKVVLYDASGKLAETKKLKTNEYGAVAGEFTLARGERNGMYRIAVEQGTRTLDDISIRVDDFVLPTFSLNFNSNDKLYYPGDVIDVDGTILAYSGHSLSGAKATYTITSYGDEMVAEDLKLEKDGKFHISYKTSYNDYTYFVITVKVVDTTGETLEWSTGRSTMNSIPFRMSVLNTAEGRTEMNRSSDYRGQYNNCIVSEDNIKVLLDVKDYRSSLTLKRSSLDISYTLSSKGKEIYKGKAQPGEILDLSLEGMPSGLYTLNAIAKDKDNEGEELRSEITYDILYIKESDTSVDADIENVFKVIDNGDEIGIMVGSCSGPTWVYVDLYGVGNVPLGSKLIKLDGKIAETGSLASVKFQFKNEWSNVVRLNVIYFRNNRSYTYSHDFDRSESRLKLPLSFTRFQDKTRPATGYSFEISTLANVECAATIYDKSTETIQANTWNEVYLFSPEAPSIYYNNVCGTNSSNMRPVIMMDYAGSAQTKGLGARLNRAKTMAVDEMMVMEDAMPEPMMMAEESNSIEMEMEEEKTEEVSVRENFANTIAFEPFLRSDAQGTINFNFKTADKLSTYYVQLFAHNKDMQNSVLRKEMVVTIPVKVSVVEPQFLYVEDKYVLKTSIASTLDNTVSGQLNVEFYDGKDYKTLKPTKVISKNVSLEAMASAGYEFDFEVPQIDELGIKVTFAANNKEYGSDAIFFSIPVYPAVQTITEAHSALLRYGEDKEKLLEQLRAEFVNISGADAEVRDLSLLEMVKEAIPSKVEPESKNVLDLTEALYVRQIADKLTGTQIERIMSDEEIVKEIIACRNSDGGFAWFSEESSSPLITITLLNRIASIRSRGYSEGFCSSLLQDKVIEGAVQYIDKSFFGERRRPEWCGGISFDQYVSVRSQFCDVPFKSNGLNGKEVKEFKKELKSWLVPSKERGLNGQVLRKARRMRIALNLTSNEDGIKLAKSWGIHFFTEKRLRKSLTADLQSLLEYAIEHKSGGWYYPNAVMPFRGLLESEAYAHVFICDLLDDAAEKLEWENTSPVDIAEGIRLWLMVQKETQKWEEDASFVEAIATILGGKEETLATRILILKSSITKPFAEIKATGNGMTISRSFFVERINEKKEKEWVKIDEGTSVAVGDRIKAEYNIWNEENRSFIKISSGIAASMRPVDQLSHAYGWWARPLMIDGWHTFSPHGYRSVLKDRTEYWFDCYPEEKTSISEEYYITQSGAFQMPVIEIESLYAPHYRANGDDTGRMQSK